MVSFVATPIGNLGDISLRALETLRAADVIFCEDTRHSLKLLNHFEIRKPLVACHKFNERAAAEKLVSLASEGKEVAVVTDAGTPVISDPGNVLVQALREAGIAYTLVPGACAFVAALVLSGFPADKFAFLGFLRGKNSEKREFLKGYALFDGTLAFYSAPQDVDDDIALLAEAFGAKGMTIANKEDVLPVLKKAFEADGPVLVDCKIGIDDKVLPMIAPGKSFEDIITKLN